MPLTAEQAKSLVEKHKTKRNAIIEKIERIKTAEVDAYLEKVLPQIEQYATEGFTQLWADRHQDHTVNLQIAKRLEKLGYTVTNNNHFSNKISIIWG